MAKRPKATTDAATPVGPYPATAGIPKSDWEPVKPTRRKRNAPQRSSGQGVYATGHNRGATQRSSGEGSSTDDEGVHEEAIRRANEAWMFEWYNVSEGRDCQRFYAGDQWDTKAKLSRMQKGRPVLTVNRLPQFCKQVTGDIRKNPPALKFLPARNGSSQETADVYNGIARHIEQSSQAKDCYIKAVENAVQAGQGYFRVMTDYAGRDAFDLDIFVQPIMDPFGALIDPWCRKFDKSDMRYAFVFDHMQLADFEAMWPGKDAGSVTAGPAGTLVYPWRVGSVVRYAEYWRRVPITKTIYMQPDGDVVEELPDQFYLLPDGQFADSPDEVPMPPGMDIDQLVASGGVKPVSSKDLLGDGTIKQREVKTFKVESYRISGGSILDGPHPWAGQYIPVCMVVGEEITMDGSTVRKGMVHDARDPQRIYNYSRTASVEAVALQPKAPFVGTVDQFKGRPEWATAGSENHAFLAYNPDPKMPGAKPERSNPAIASQGLDSQALIAANDMEAVIGIYKPMLGAPSNETSGIAIARRQQEGDTGTFLYPDNLSRAIGYLGKILADLIPRVYDTERQVRILKEDGTSEMQTVNRRPPPGMMPQNGQIKVGGKFVPLHDLSAGEYDVVVTTGPTFATQRAEAAANMADLIGKAPKLLDIAGDLLVKNLDWPGADELAKRIQKTMPQYLVDDDAPPPPPPQPPPQDQAKLVNAIADAQLVKAQTEGVNLDNAGKILMLGQQVQQLWAQVQALQNGGPMPSQGAGPPGAPPQGPMPAGPPNGGSGPVPPPGGLAPNGGGLPMVDVNEGPGGP